MKQRKDGRWQKNITINGKRKTFYSSANTEKQAERDITQQLVKYHAEEKKSGLFKEVAKRWNDKYLQRISYINYKKCSKAAYERVLSHFGKYYVHELNVQIITVFLNELCLMGYSRKTVSLHKSILNQIMSSAVYEGFIIHNPVSEVRVKSNLPRTIRELPTTEELKIVDNHYTGFDFLPYFLLYTGLRISEALALTDEDFDLNKRLVTINKHVVWDSNNPLIEYRTKTINSQRKVVIIDRLFEKLPKFKGYLFCNEDGSLLTKGQLRKRWEKYQKTYNVNFTAHQLRHGFATICFEAGISEKDAQELMGHSDISLTRAIYTHIRSERKEETVMKLNSFSF